MPGPRDVILYWPGPRAFSVVQKPRGWAHISVQKPRGAGGGGGGGGMVTGQIDTCIRTLEQSWVENENDIMALGTRLEFRLFGKDNLLTALLTF